MPGVAVLTHADMMMGVDCHDEVAPPGSPAPAVTHIVAGLLWSPPWGIGSGKPNPTVWASGRMVLSQGSDMGLFIPHIPVPAAPANLLVPLLNAASGSKSNFGVQKNRAGQGPLAAACAGQTGLNLNCGGSTTPPGLSGAVLALFQTVQQGFTWGDLIAGALRVVADAYLQHGLNALLNEGSPFVQWMAWRVVGPMAARATLLAARLSPLASRAGAAIVHELVHLAVGFPADIGTVSKFLAGMLVGSPLGYSPQSTPSSRLGDGEDALQDAISSSLNRLFEDPSIEQFPSAAEVGPWPL